MARNITPRDQDYPQWYLDVIKAAELADYSPVRGCMVIRPGGYALWEAIQRDLDTRFKETGHVNAYFPLLIPVSFLEKEARHVEGFAMECAVVTHSGLERLDEGGLVPSGRLTEPLIIRPTSETLFGHMYAQWIQSYRDLPLLINQWANVMRWELRTRLFLRTAEFLWQEGHTAHETEEEAKAETLRILRVYADFCRETLAIPVVQGRKTEKEKFPGAVTTYAVEALMQDRKALQAGTSHHLGQNFSRAFEMKFLGRDNQLQYCWTTSWGVSTRLIGAVLMTHSDDEGLVLPPRIAPVQVAVLPIYRTAEDKGPVLEQCRRILAGLAGEERVAAAERRDAGREILNVFLDKAAFHRAVLDCREVRPVEKHYYWEQRGVPFRLEIGPRDVAQESFVLKSRFDGSRSFHPVAEATPEWLRDLVDRTQEAMYRKALAFREEHTVEVSSYAELRQALLERRGFVRCWFAEDPEAEAAIQEETRGTVRVIPFDQPGGPGKCVYSGREATEQALFAVAY